MWEIIEWNERYEVNSKSHQWEPGQEFRKGTLEYIRWKVHGRALGEGYRRMIEAAGEDKALMVFGLYAKLTEIAGDEKVGKRNKLPPPEDVAFILHAPVDQVRYGYKIMAQLGWLRETPGEVQQSPNIPGDSGKFPEIPGDSRKFPSIQSINQINQTNKSINIEIEEKRSRWELVKELSLKLFPGNRGIQRVLAWIANNILVKQSPAQQEAGIKQLLKLLNDSQQPGVKDPPAWFMECLKREFGYRAHGGKPAKTVRIDEAAKKLIGA